MFVFDLTFWLLGELEEVWNVPARVATVPLYFTHVIVKSVHLAVLIGGSLYLIESFARWIGYWQVLWYRKQKELKTSANVKVNEDGVKMVEQ